MAEGKRVRRAKVWEQEAIAAGFSAASSAAFRGTDGLLAAVESLRRRVVPWYANLPSASRRGVFARASPKHNAC